jgi:hypothetical protein
MRFLEQEGGTGGLVGTALASLGGKCHSLGPTGESVGILREFNIGTAAGVDLGAGECRIIVSLTRSRVVFNIIDAWGGKQCME